MLTGLSWGSGQSQPGKELFCNQPEVPALSGLSLLFPDCMGGALLLNVPEDARPGVLGTPVPTSCVSTASPSARGASDPVPHGSAAMVSLTVTSGTSDVTMSLWAWPTGALAGGRPASTLLPSQRAARE